MSVTKIQNILVIGISGVTCGGKTTTATELNNILPKSKIFTQDDYYRDINDSKHIWIPDLNHINFDIISSLDMDKMYADVIKYIEEHKFSTINNKNSSQMQKNGFYSNGFDSDLHQAFKKSNIFVIIIEGFSIFNYKSWLHLFDLKYYFELDKEECYKRRLQRVYEPPDVPGYFEKCVWPEHLKLKQEIKEFVKNVVHFQSGDKEVIVGKILNDIYEFL